MRMIGAWVKENLIAILLLIALFATMFFVIPVSLVAITPIVYEMIPYYPAMEQVLFISFGLMLIYLPIRVIKAFLEWLRIKACHLFREREFTIEQFIIRVGKFTSNNNRSEFIRVVRKKKLLPITDELDSFLVSLLMAIERDVSGMQLRLFHLGHFHFKQANAVLSQSANFSSKSKVFDQWHSKYRPKAKFRLASWGAETSDELSIFLDQIRSNDRDRISDSQFDEK